MHHIQTSLDIVVVKSLYNESVEQMTVKKCSCSPSLPLEIAFFFFFNLKSPVDEILSLSFPQNQCHQPCVLISKAREGAGTGEEEDGLEERSACGSMG